MLRTLLDSRMRHELHIALAVAFLVILTAIGSAKLMFAAAAIALVGSLFLFRTRIRGEAWAALAGSITALVIAIAWLVLTSGS